MEKVIYGIDCSEIKDQEMIERIRLVLSKIEEKHPKDLAKITAKVKHIKPLTKEQRDSGDMGWWAESEETICISNELKDSELTIGILAHELGHVCTTENDRERRKCPNYEWESEAVADWYACKWGYREIIRKLQNTIYKSTHHGCAPGKQIKRIIGDFVYTFTVSRNFVYKRVSVTQKPQWSDLFVKGLEFLKSGNDFDLAIANFSKVIEMDSFNFESYSFRGEAYFRLNNHKEAIIDFTTAIEIEPNYVPAYMNRGFVYETIGKTKEAKADFAKVKELEK
jgi:tetratricopeptide (TPR) repeat protein